MKVTDGRVHDLALDLLASKGPQAALPLLWKNYRRSDDAIIAGLIKGSSVIPAQIQNDIGKIYRRHRSPDAGPILLQTYRRGQRAHTRYYIVRAMRHCGALSNAIIEECLYDSYVRTRDFARRIAPPGLLGGHPDAQPRGWVGQAAVCEYFGDHDG